MLNGLGDYKMKSILLLANGGKEWIGGLYYAKNILHTFLKQNNKQDYNIYILVNSENVDLFKKYENDTNIKIIIYKDTYTNRTTRRLTSKLFKSPLDMEVLSLCRKYNIDTVYPVRGYAYMGLTDKCVHWIPDFQYVYLPQLFSKEEVNDINKVFTYIAKNHKKLVLSSNDAFDTYKELYPEYTENVCIMPFLSDISEELSEVNNEFIKSVIEKYNIPSKFIFIANQFWVHKNYMTAFKAINYIVNEQNIDICLVCTGNTKDYRSKDHFKALTNFIRDNSLENNIKILGFISRKEQLALMKQSVMVVQPSLFEGWGTSVEDAKVINKKIVLSDIKVHYEQSNDKCIIFKRDDYIDLGNKILENLS
jgi:glycosyltransferase involved in cell wall biosynthesis